MCSFVSDDWLWQEREREWFQEWKEIEKFVDGKMQRKLVGAWIEKIFIYLFVRFFKKVRSK